jgi:catechol 2,3-dioxygenase-like lactoylglutathione lyase family enzyme
MIDHFGINCADYARSQQFYDRVLGALGYSRELDVGEAIGYGRDGTPVFWIAEGVGMGPNRETHFAFAAADHDAVRAFHDAAVELAPSRCTRRDCGRSTTRATSPPSSGTRTATTSKPSAMRRVGFYV